MNNAISPQDHSQSEVTGEDIKYSPVGYLAFWPAIVAGLFICMAMFGIMPPHTTLLVWLPVLLLAALVLLAIVNIPRVRKAKEESWEKRLREAAEAKAAAAALAPEEAAEPVVVAAKPVEAPKAAAAPIVAGDVDVLILWGSETGTAQGLAEMTETKLKDSGVTARAVSMSAVTVNHLPGYNKVLVITSTWGDGEPPSNGIDMWEALQKEKVDLSKTSFSVLSLGDTAYPLFCKCGQDFDKFLASHGAQRLHPRVDCDLNYEANFEKWLNGVQAAIAK